MTLSMSWTLHLNFFVQSLNRYESFEELWKESQYLIRYGRLSNSDISVMTFVERKFRMKTINEWLREENESHSGKSGGSSKPAKVSRYRRK